MPPKYGRFQVSGFGSQVDVTLQMRIYQRAVQADLLICIELEMLDG
jgi:hypothetical protein